MSESDKLEEIKQLVIANNQRVNDLLKKGASKPLKSSRLEVQTKFNEEVIALLERGENDAIDEAVEMLKARNLLLKKGDTKPEFFGFFDNHRDAKPDLSFAQCVQEALQEFAKVEATTPSSSQKQRVPAERKRAWPFRSGGGSYSRPTVAVNPWDIVASQQHQLLHQQLAQQQAHLFGFPNPGFPGRTPAPIQRQQLCFSCKSYGHISRNCPQAGMAPRQ
ncbi:hypothetical protein QR680_014203 [Steinernema hermaphroditum]|uniref:CCHC-type domain-containing protein n=1 Tax=Steinernema hermaphroditum TaxID=289476 RepID=A0AA39IAN6_9BILA|nr:hypothetical protein QR680_016995 [Steinernema hermaphroditum]KAK0419547.1 hypothetical protein QR680_014203 [Steinernema hermaphroditum]